MTRSEYEVKVREIKGMKNLSPKRKNYMIRELTRIYRGEDIKYVESFYIPSTFFKCNSCKEHKHKKEFYKNVRHGCKTCTDEYTLEVQKVQIERKEKEQKDCPHRNVHEGVCNHCDLILLVWDGKQFNKLAQRSS